MEVREALKLLDMARERYEDTDIEEAIDMASEALDAQHKDAITAALSWLNSSTTPQALNISQARGILQDSLHQAANDLVAVNRDSADKPIVIDAREFEASQTNPDPAWKLLCDNAEGGEMTSTCANCSKPIAAKICPTQPSSPRPSSAPHDPRPCNNKRKDTMTEQDMIREAGRLEESADNLYMALLAPSMAEQAMRDEAARLRQTANLQHATTPPFNAGSA